MRRRRDPGEYLDGRARYSARDVAAILAIWEDSQGAERAPTGAEVVRLLEIHDRRRRELEERCLRACREVHVIAGAEIDTRPRAAEAVTRG